MTYVWVPKMAREATACPYTNVPPHSRFAGASTHCPTQGKLCLDRQSSGAGGDAGAEAAGRKGKLRHGGRKGLANTKEKPWDMAAQRCQPGEARVTPKSKVCPRKAVLCPPGVCLSLPNPPRCRGWLGEPLGAPCLLRLLWQLPAHPSPCPSSSSAASLADMAARSVRSGRCQAPTSRSGTRPRAPVSGM